MGVVALSQACCLAFEQWPLLQSIHAFIRSDNLRSIKAFSKVGFNPIQSNNDQHSTQVEMVLDRQAAECESKWGMQSPNSL